ncbi:hypothetical protein PROFUN_13401 [Planoprotostelium fungivorum]|uniref:Uncharacterized protein n=1 Tax=Planoprotostelium fungivorum TaxID=1890364 RepID=A0A2P6N3N5_9EUKA|nr:hypothetical protein PROFUN_13401 [Planoprotostelium fungivorum]
MRPLKLYALLLFIHCIHVSAFRWRSLYQTDPTHSFLKTILPNKLGLSVESPSNRVAELYRSLAGSPNALPNRTPSHPLTPVIIVSSLAGSILQGYVDESYPLPYRLDSCRTPDSWFEIWVNEASFAYHRECMYYNLGFDYIDGKYVSRRGIRTRVPYYGEVRGVKRVHLDKLGTANIGLSSPSRLNNTTILLVSLLLTIESQSLLLIYLLNADHHRRKMTDPNLPTLRTCINGLVLTLAKKIWAQEKLDAHPNLASTLTLETDVDLIAHIKASTVTPAVPTMIDKKRMEGLLSSDLGSKFYGPDKLVKDYPSLFQSGGTSDNEVVEMDWGSFWDRMFLDLWTCLKSIVFERNEYLQAFLHSEHALYSFGRKHCTPKDIIPLPHRVQCLQRLQLNTQKSHLLQAKSLSCLGLVLSIFLGETEQDETKSTLVSVSSRQFSPESHENDIQKLQCRANDISHHIPPDVATTNLNTKCKPIPNKSHNSMQVVAETRYFIYLALLSKKVVQRSIRWAQIERVLDGDTMDLPMISQPGLRGYSRGDVNSCS